MNVRKSFSVCPARALLAGFILLSGTALAGDSGPRQDARAIDLLNSMTAYIQTLDSFVIKGAHFQDATLGEGLLVSNSTEVMVRANRPGSLRITSFDGMEHKEIIIHEGTMTVSNQERGFYAQASVPKELDVALDFALEKFEIETPLMDLLKQGESTGLLGPQDTILYLTDKARISGQDCHQIAIRGPETDVQLWIVEGDHPLPIQFMMTAKWEGGSPRVINNMTWDPGAEFDTDEFTFTAPEGSVNIGFIQNQSEGGQ